MNERGLDLFDLDGLVQHFNDALANPNEPIRLEPFVRKEPKRIQYGSRLTDENEIRIENEIRQRFNLIQTEYGDGRSGECDLKFDKSIGHISTVAGWRAAGIEDYYVESRYEELRLRTNFALKLSDGESIPKCSVTLYQIRRDSGELIEDRRDSIKYWGFVPVRADLRDVLPTEWFLGDRTIEHYEIRK